MVVEFLLQKKCKYCQQDFLICRSCYRGQCYCCDRCRFIAQKESRRRAQQRYRLTEKGRKAHREAERRRRIRKARNIQKTVDDKGSTPPIPHAILFKRPLNSSEFCHHCGVAGVIVKKFPRRAYGGRSSRRNYDKKATYKANHSA